MKQVLHTKIGHQKAGNSLTSVTYSAISERIKVVLMPSTLDEAIA